ncbi:Udp-glycosyltransferase 85a8 [Thalictrum thalictroides]|uniref:Udp-glycosyltransferase 85a8 n=1 Tax=Thalictrum thalictroides TaxID=46969 RepID=A0A7J6V3L8_THATH|nr:Udp-glycosyltransferase 85a8 [Thalictrum thalictroides]
MSASVLHFFYHRQILDKALLKLKDKSYAANDEYLDMPIDFIPGLRHMRLKDVPTFFWDRVYAQKHTAVWREMEKYTKASAIVVNTFDELEREALDAMKSIPPAIYPIGPLQFLEEEIPNKLLRTFGNNLLKEHTNCLEWLDSQEPNSVVYVSFGTSAVMTNDNLIEFAWGLANCKHPFLLVINPDLLIGKEAILPPGFTKDTADRAMISGWCPQEEVLCHSSTGGFLTHSGWSSTMDTISAGVPIISWPSSFIDQVTNCRNAVLWGTGLEIDINVKRDKVEKMVRELMESDKGKEMKKKAMEWKKSAQESIKPGGSSYVNLDKLIQEVLLH